VVCKDYFPEVKAVMGLRYVLCGIVECAGVTLIWRVGTELGEAVKIGLTCLCSVFMVLIVPVFLFFWEPHGSLAVDIMLFL
jgi:hypothetical protein